MTPRMQLPRLLRTPLGWISLVTGLLVLGMPSIEGAQAKVKSKSCPEGMASIGGRFCIDKFEASTVELLGASGAGVGKGKDGKKAKAKGPTRKHSPYESVDNLVVKAVTKRGVIPQAHISRDQAEAACQNAGKRLCSDDEWISACKGKSPTQYPYGDEHKAGVCNDSGVSSFNLYFGVDGAEAPREAYNWANMNDPRLNQMKGTVAKTGGFKRCKGGYDVYDMVGNLHEWTSSPRGSKGTFRGGYYLDTHQHGDGCDYKTTAHSPKYHDYSTGFRCCKD